MWPGAGKMPGQLVDKTEREREVLAGVAQGERSKEIAARRQLRRSEAALDRAIVNIGPKCA